MGNQLDGRINRLEQLRGVNGGPPQIIVCWHLADDDCDCIANDDDTIIKVRYEDIDQKPDPSPWA